LPTALLRSSLPEMLLELTIAGRYRHVNDGCRAAMIRGVAQEPFLPDA